MFNRKLLEQMAEINCGDVLNLKRIIKKNKIRMRLNNINLKLIKDIILGSLTGTIFTIKSIGKWKKGRTLSR